MSTAPAAGGPAATFGIAFDVDGVLYAGSAKDPIPEAPDVVQALWNADRTAIRIPHVFVTNGTGYSEAGKVRGACHAARLGAAGADPPASRRAPLGPR